MILVDSSVWIDYFRGTATPESERLDGLLGSENLAIGDLILTEVLQGFGAAKNFRTLRSLGVTVRKTIDTIIATRCIVSNFALLFSDRDFDPFVEHLGLRSALKEA